MNMNKTEKMWNNYSRRTEVEKAEDLHLTQWEKSILCQVDKPRKLASLRNIEDMDKSWKYLLPDWNGERKWSEGMEAGDCCLLACAFNV